MTRCRIYVTEEILSRLEVLEGAPTAEAEAYKKHVLRLFVTNGPRAATRRALLLVFPNGDWRAPCVQYYLRPNEVGIWTEAKIAKSVAEGLVAALCNASPHVYDRHRWAGVIWRQTTWRP